MSDDIVLHAPGVHSGGGLVLLRALLAAWPPERRLRAILDARAADSLDLPSNSQCHWVHPTIRARLMAEVILRRHVGTGGTVLCFHGLPPLLPTRARVLVLLQNRLHLGRDSLSQFRWKTRLRLNVERWIGRGLRRRVAEYLVQTPTMRRAAEAHFGIQPARQQRVRVLPFVEEMKSILKTDGDSKRWDFVYVADGEAHKNHWMLFAAWKLMADDGMWPSLALTLGPRDVALKDEASRLRDELGLRIHDVGVLSRDQIVELYMESGAMIFASLTESFGLPLIEATRLGLPIVAPELDYVRDVCLPAQTFDPSSALSIARAVRRFLDCPEPTGALMTASEFWRELIEDRGQ